MRNEFFNKMFAGLVLIAIGVAFLLNQMDIFTVNIGDIFENYWPVLIIFFGLKGLFSAGRYAYKGRGSVFGSLVVILVGLIFLGKNLNWVDMSYGDMFKYFIPVLLILFGISIIFKPFRRGYHHPENDGGPGNGRRPGAKAWHDDFDKFDKFDRFDKFDQTDGWEPGDDWKEPREDGKERKDEWKEHRDEWKQRRDEWKQRKDEWKMRKNEWKHHHGWDHKHLAHRMQNKSGFLGDLYLGHEYWHLEPMNISHFIGDTTLDLTKATIPDGETRLNISSFIGDVKLFLPNDVDVEVKVIASSFIGDYRVLDQQEGGFMKSANMESGNYADAEKKIRVNASMFIGDVIVRRVG